MSTINRRTMEYGYCENINKNRRIKIAYASLPQFDNNRRNSSKYKIFV